MTSRRKSLAVQSTEGGLLTAEIVDMGDRVFITTQPIFETIEDGTNDTPDGRIKIVVTKEGYLEAIDKLETYLEGLMLRRLSREDRNTSINRKFDSGRPREEPVGHRDTDGAGEEGSLVGAGGDGDKPPSRSRKRNKPKPVLAEESDPSPEEGSKGGDETVLGSREGDE